MVENMVLGVEAGSGKYLVFTDQNTRLFVAFRQKGIGGHADMANRLDMTAYSKKVSDRDLQSFGTRPEIIRALNETIKVSKQIPQLNFVSSDNYKGGMYAFENGAIRLYDTSRDYGAPSSEALQELERSLLGYVDSQGNQIKEVKIV